MGSRPRLLNMRETGGHPPDGVVRIDRRGPWGNPFSHVPNTKARWMCSSRNESVDRFHEWVLHSDDREAVWIREHISELEGKDLICWCTPRRCHGEVLMELANG